MSSIGTVKDGNLVQNPQLVTAELSFVAFSANTFTSVRIEAGKETADVTAKLAYAVLGETKSAGGKITATELTQFQLSQEQVGLFYMKLLEMERNKGEINFSEIKDPVQFANAFQARLTALVEDPNNPLILSREFTALNELLNNQRNIDGKSDLSAGQKAKQMTAGITEALNKLSADNNTEQFLAAIKPLSTLLDSIDTKDLYNQVEPLAKDNPLRSELLTISELKKTVNSLRFQKLKADYGRDGASKAISSIIRGFDHLDSEGTVKGFDSQLELHLDLGPENADKQKLRSNYTGCESYRQAATTLRLFHDAVVIATELAPSPLEQAKKTEQPNAEADGQNQKGSGASSEASLREVERYLTENQRLIFVDAVVASLRGEKPSLTPYASGSTENKEGELQQYVAKAEEHRTRIEAGDAMKRLTIRTATYMATLMEDFAEGMRLQKQKREGGDDSIQSSRGVVITSLSALASENFARAVGVEFRQISITTAN